MIQAINWVCLVLFLASVTKKFPNIGIIKKVIAFILCEVTLSSS